MNILTLEQAADLLQVSHTTVYEYCRNYPDFPVTKLSARTWRIREDLLLEWMTSRIGRNPRTLSESDSPTRNDVRLRQVIAANLNGK